MNDCLRCDAPTLTDLCHACAFDIVVDAVTCVYCGKQVFGYEAEQGHHDECHGQFMIEQNAETRAYFE